MSDLVLNPEDSFCRDVAHFEMAVQEGGSNLSECFDNVTSITSNVILNDISGHWLQD